jgi:hypothetical protein
MQLSSSCNAWHLVILQQAVMGEKMKEMSQEERKDFITQQMDALQHELEKASTTVPCVVMLIPG